ncbi:MAG: hypothetical protein EPO39_11895 [Candidatus Manganitrophaceae bacterium]|nr:MAG: hypothetical protein EPO39_11895 [Candidatus Manganitrophaceae bacterium]
MKKEGISITQGKKVRVIIRTIHTVYTGDLFVPSKRNRFSDVMNEPSLVFISLTDVKVEGTPDKIKHLALNKFLIESIRLDE